MSFYDLTAKDSHGKEVAFDSPEIKGKVLLIVNTATQCGYARQFPALEALYEKHKEEGFELLLFPSNQFKQQPGTDEEIHEEYRNKVGMTSMLFAESDINGPDANPVYVYLKQEIGYDPNDVIPEGMVAYYKKFDEDYTTNSDIKWNFTKFLVDKSGNILKRYEPEVTPEQIEKDIIAALTK